MRRLVAVVVLVVAAVVAVAACGGDDDDGDAGGAPAAPNTVVIEDIAFKPSDLTVDAGDTVTWEWNDGSVVHDVKFDDFASELQNSGTYRHTFDTAGTFDYTCSVHPQMDGTITVR